MGGRTTVRWAEGAPEVKYLAREAIEGGNRFYYSNGHLDDWGNEGSNWSEHSLSTALELRPGSYDHMLARYDNMVSAGLSADTEAVELADYFARRDAAIAARDRPTMEAAFNSDVAAVRAGNLGVSQRAIDMGTLLYPNAPWARAPRMRESLADFVQINVGTVAGMGVGGATYGWLAARGAGMTISGVTAGLTGDLTLQGVDNAAYALSGGRYGRQGINEGELALSAGLVLLPGAVTGVRGWWGSGGAVGNVASSEGASLGATSRVGANNPWGSGAGPIPGTIGVAPSSESVAALRNYFPGKNVEYVFDPNSSTFLVGNGMKHSPLAEAPGADTNTVVGGIFSRGENGEILSTEGSGHFWQNWAPEVRQQYVDFMNSKGFKVVHHEGH